MAKKYQINLKNNPYAQKPINETTKKAVIYKKDLKTRQEVMKNTMIVQMSFRSLVGKHFDKITDMSVRYKIFKGAKGTKKSETIIA